MTRKDKISAVAQMVVSWAALGVFKLLFRFEAEGGENLKGLENSPVIFASNHNSYIDGGIAGASLLKSGVRFKKFFPVKYLVGQQYFGWRYFPVNIFVTFVGSVKLKRAGEKTPDNSHLLRVLSEPIATLASPSKIWIYPQGGFNNDGTPKKPRHGVIFLHQRTKAPIVPVKMIGNDKAMSKLLPFLPAFKTLLMLNKIRVVFGKPVYLLDIPDIDVGTKILMDKIEELV